MVSFLRKRFQQARCRCPRRLEHPSRHPAISVMACSVDSSVRLRLPVTTGVERANRLTQGIEPFGQPAVCTLRVLVDVLGKPHPRPISFQVGFAVRSGARRPGPGRWGKAARTGKAARDRPSAWSEAIV